MKTVDLRATASAWTTEVHPNRNLSGGPVLYISSGTVRRAFLWFARPVPLGATVQSATLRLTFGNGWAGKSFHLEVLRIIEAWKSSKITDLNAPDVDVLDGGDDLSGITQNETVEFDVTALVQDVADGSAWYGLRVAVTSGATAGDQVLFGSGALSQERRPELLITYAETPAAPTGLHPGSGHVVGISRPTLAWSFVSSDPNAVQGWSQVQLSTDLTFATAEWDSGMIANNLPEQQVGIDLDTGTIYYWRVQVKDSAGLASAWSDPVSFTFAAHPDVEIVYPAADDDVIPDSTPLVVHGVAGGVYGPSGAMYGPEGAAYGAASSQERVQHLILDADGVVLWDSGEQVTASLVIEIPAGVIRFADVSYTLVIRVWDWADREATPGDPAYSEARRRFSYSPSADVLPVILLTAEARIDPGVDLTWRHLGSPEGFALLIDGEIVADQIVPSEVGTGTDYEMTYWRAPPGPHTFEVQAIVFDGDLEKHSSGNATAALDVAFARMWVFRPSTGEAVPVWGTGEPDMIVGEDSTVYAPIGRDSPLVVTSSLRGYEATLEGALLDDESGTPTAMDYRALLESWVALAGTDELRVAFGPYNIPVVLVAGKHIAARRGGGYTVALPFAQAGEVFA